MSIFQLKKKTKKLRKTNFFIFLFVFKKKIGRVIIDIFQQN
jgi:hypothetical protein